MIIQLDINKISEPVKGTRGYYLIKVLNRTKFDSTAFDAQRTSIEQSILQEKRGSFFSEWIQKIKEDADIQDNRNYYQ